MILSLVMWLAMAGQGQHGKYVVCGQLPCFQAEPLDNLISGTPPTHADKGAWMWTKPAEHVIEIRTKRTRALVAWQQPDEHGSCPQGFTLAIDDPKFSTHVECEKTVSVVVRKTLWIDNQRIGVIREVKEK